MKKIMMLILCIALSFGMVSNAFAADIYWVDDGSMDGNTEVDKATALLLSGAIFSKLGASKTLANKTAKALSALITGQTIVDNDAYIYYTVDQQRGVEYNGLGEGYDKYYLRQTTHVYPNSSRNESECIGETTKTVTSISPFFIIPK